MNAHALTPWESGWILARAVRGAHGQILAPAGTPLSKELTARLLESGITKVDRQRVGTPLPALPEHIARYDATAESTLVAIFAPTLHEPLMAQLLVSATAHAVRRRRELEACG